MDFEKGGFLWIIPPRSSQPVLDGLFPVHEDCATLCEYSKVVHSVPEKLEGVQVKEMAAPFLHLVFNIIDSHICPPFSLFNRPLHHSELLPFHTGDKGKGYIP